MAIVPEEDEWAALREFFAKEKESKKPPKLIEYELYCRSCQLYWSESHFSNEAVQPFQCKNYHQSVRLLSQTVIQIDSKNGHDFFELEHGLVYNDNEDGGYF